MRIIGAFYAHCRVALTVSLLPAAGFAQRTSRSDAALSVAPYMFVSRAGDTVRAELGHFRVPEARGSGGNDTIVLAFVRFASTSARPGPPIIYLAGGPGGSGIALARGPRFPVFMAMRAAGDVIALDQRGTGLSMPNLACPQGVTHPLDRALTPAAESKRLRTVARACAAHWRARGVHLDAYNTEESADDLEALRRALGVEQVVLWGASYGTHLGLSAMRRHPSLAARAILAGIEGPDDTFKLPSASDHQLDTLSSLAHANTALTAAIPDVRAALQRVLTRLDRAPAVVRLVNPNATRAQAAASADSVTLVIGRADFLNFINGALGNGEGMALVPALIAAASHGDFTLPARYILSDRTSASIGSAMGFAMDCASGASAARRDRLRRETRSSLFGVVANDPLFDACDVWGVRELGDSFRRPVHSTVPVLFISGTLDLNTPVSNARAVAGGFPNARELLIDGASHGDALFLASPEIPRAMLDFLDGRSTRARIDVPFRIASDLSLATITASKPTDSSVAFTHATVIDGGGGPARTGMTVVVQGDRIVRLGKDATLRAPAGARMIDARGKYLMPGLWDMHVHVAKAGSSSLSLFVANGITSVRDMGGDFAMIRAIRDSVRTGTHIGPRIMTPGPMLEDAANVSRMLSEGTVEPVARFRVPVATVADAERVVDSLSTLGVDFVKIRTVASREIYFAIGNAVRRHGLTLVGHMVSTPDEILAVNQRSVEHAILSQLATLPASERQRILRAFGAAGIVMVPTLVVGEKSLFVPDSIAAALVSDSAARLDPRWRYVSGYLVADWREQIAERKQGPPVPWTKIVPGLLALQREIHDAGVRMLPGTDVAVALLYPGFSLHEELEQMVRHLGMTPAEVIVSATRYPAEFFGMQDSLGTIAVGKLADLVLLDADPLVDIRNTTRIRGVFTGGRYLDRTALDALLSGLARARALEVARKR